MSQSDLAIEGILEHRPLIRKIVINTLNLTKFTKEDIEDAVSDATINLLAGVSSLRDGDALVAWIARTAKLSTYNYIRQWRRHQRRINALVATRGERPTSCGGRWQMENQCESRQLLREVLSKICPYHGDILRMYFLEGNTYQMAAKRLGISTASFKRHLKAALKSVVHISGSATKTRVRLSDESAAILSEILSDPIASE